LLILVRSLFTRFEWGDKQVGALVTWDELYDLLVEETTYIPLWVQEMVENKLIPSAGGDEGAFSVRVAKALYLLNQVRSEVPSTPANLARLMVKSTDESFESVRGDVESALSDLLEDRKVLTETNDRGDEEYLLVSEEQGHPDASEDSRTADPVTSTFGQVGELHSGGKQPPAIRGQSTRGGSRR